MTDQRPTEPARPAVSPDTAAPAPERSPAGTDPARPAPWAALAFAATLLLSALFAVALLQPPAANSHGLPHAEVSAMLQGGDGAARHGGRLPLAWALGASQILLFAALLALGAARGGRLRGMGPPLLVGLVLFLTAWTLLIVSYAGFLEDPHQGLLFALPAPTAAMLYLLWPAPLAFVLIFVLGFRRFVLSEEDERRFARLVARRRAREAGEARETVVEEVA